LTIAPVASVTVPVTALVAAYLGNAAHHYEERPNIDPENTDGTYPLPGWNGVQENTNSGSSFYSGLILRAEKRYSSGFSLLGSYTFSKCLGWPWQDVFSWHPLDMRLDRGHCQEDINHVLSVNSIYELPFGKGKTFLNNGGLTDAAVGGWKLAAIVSYHTGIWSTLGSSNPWASSSTPCLMFRGQSTIPICMGAWAETANSAPTSTWRMCIQSPMSGCREIPRCKV
jgi:hypothetical protein